MQLRVVHTTDYTYDGQAVASYNQARLTPVTNHDQIVVHSRVEVSPKPWTFDYRDYFGSHVTAFEVVDPHEVMTVVASSTVQTARHAPEAPAATWADLEAPEVADRWTEYLTLSDVVAPPADLADRARQVAADHETPGEVARDLAALVHDEVEFRPGVTSVSSPAALAWAQRAGVCQDTAHLLLGALRTVGIPARYVSGYVHPDRDPVVGQAVSAQPHAWVEWWDGEWHGHDVAGDQTPDDRYVTVAVGRDYDDVKPISGIYSGAATSAMRVAVEITRLA